MLQRLMLALGFLWIANCSAVQAGVGFNVSPRDFGTYFSVLLGRVSTDLQIGDGDCNDSADGMVTCRYDLSGNIFIAISGKADGNSHKGLALVGNQGWDAKSFTSTIALLSAMYTPDAESPGDGEEFMDLISGLNDGKLKTVRIGVANFRMVVNSTVGMTVWVQPIN